MQDPDIRALTSDDDANPDMPALITDEDFSAARSARLPRLRGHTHTSPDIIHRRIPSNQGG